jgi:hypothetical protein
MNINKNKQKYFSLKKEKFRPSFTETQAFYMLKLNEEKHKKSKIFND